MKRRRGLAGSFAKRTSRPGRRRLELEQFEDRLLMASLVVSNNNDVGVGSLRDAINTANTNGDAANRITFNLVATQTITPASALLITGSNLTIDGTLGAGGRVEIAGTNPALGTSASGLTVGGNATGVTLANLTIDRFGGSGIVLGGGGSSSVVGSNIGTDPTGLVLRGNGGNGISVTSPNNTIGGVTASLRNVVTGNAQAQVALSASAAQTVIVGNFIGVDSSGTRALAAAAGAPDGIQVNSANNAIGGLSAGSRNIISGNNYGISFPVTGGNNNLVRGNYIGTDVTGTAAIPNGQYGIFIAGAANNQIGGSVSGAGNLISGNALAGVFVNGPGVTGTRLFGNGIGTSAGSTTSGVPNGAGTGGVGGVVLRNAPGVLIGTTQLTGTTPPGFGNTIAFNTGVGVQVDTGANDGILTNSIFGNSGLGIQLINNGNAGIQAPFINSVDTTATTALIQGSITGQAGVRYRIQFFSNPTLAGAINSGQTFIGEADVTSTSVFTNFATTIQATVATGSYITATVTQNPQVLNNTSQFSNPVAARESQTPDLGVSIATNPTNLLTGQPFTYQYSVNNTGKSTASNTVLTVTLPVGVQYSLNGGATYQTSTAAPVQFQLGDIAAGAPATVINVRVIAPVTLSSATTSAVVTSSTAETNNTNNSATLTKSFAAVADLAVFLTPPPDRIPLQSRASYVVTVVNSGPNIAGTAVVEVTLPASLANIMVGYDQSRVQVVGNLVRINLGTRPAPDSTQIMISGTATEVGTFDASARVFEANGEFDSDTTNNVAPVAGGAPIQITVANSADLAISVGATPNPVLIGGTLTYGVSVRNNGPSDATAPVITLAIPNGLFYDPSASSVDPSRVTQSGSTLSIALDAIPSGGLSEIFLGFTPTLPGQVSATFAVSNAPDIDTIPANNTATAVVSVSPADLGISVAGPTGPLSIGVPVSYVVTVTNAGPGLAPNVLVTDGFSDLGTITGVTSSRTGVTSTISSTTGLTSAVSQLGSLAPGETVILTINLTPTRSGVLYSNNRVTTTGFDPDDRNNVATTGNQVSPANLVVTTVATPGPVLLGGIITYTITVGNLGPATATNVVLRDVLPNGTVQTSLDNFQGTAPGGSVFVAGLGDLAPGASTQVVLRVNPAAVGTLTNVASVSSDNFDPDTTDNTSTSGVAIFNQAGTLALTAGTASVNETAGSVTLTIARTDGTAGAVAVNYATANGTAVAGVNYTATSGTLVFAAGETAKTITIPILRDGVIGPNLNFRLALSGPTNGASLGPQDAAVITVVNTDRDQIAPRVSGVEPIQTRAGITGFVVTFNEPMDAARAQLVSNYAISLSPRDPGRNAGQPVAIASATLDPTGTVVTLTTAAPLPANRFYLVNLNGSAGQALTDLSGNVLDGTGTGVAGGNYLTTIGQGNTLRYVDSSRNLVTITLRRGGTMTIIRDAAGDTTSINLEDIVARRSILSGSVRRPRGSTGGRVSIGVVTGLRRFGDVRSNLTTAPFFATFAPVIVNGGILTSSAVAASARVVSAAVPVRPARF